MPVTFPDKSDLFRRLPSVDDILKMAEASALELEYGRQSVIRAVRSELDHLRARIAGEGLAVDALDHILASLPAAIADRVRATSAPSLRRVINAGGVVINTNLGRSPLSREAAERIRECALGYSNLEFDLEKGERGRRDDHARNLMDQLLLRHGIGGTSTIVVNNNAAAVFLALSALAQGGEVIVSRGELVEIGGAFRIPDIMAQSGAVLREVGTTNRTRIADYENAITENTRLLLRVHRSNFEIVGFTERPDLTELVALGRRRGIAVMEDLGSGALVNTADFGIADEPGLYESLQAGVDVVTYSGDKLLGGPQAGLVTGQPDLVSKLRSYPLFRALRVDKMCYAALEATLTSYLREQYDQIPLLRMLRLSAAEVRRRCEALAEAVQGCAVEVVATHCMIGGGSAPGKSVPSFALALNPGDRGAKDLARRLRHQAIPVVTRVEDGRVLLDLRTVDAEDDGYLGGILGNLAS